MVDFRKSLVLLAVLVVFAGIASAQPSICQANAAVPPLLRSEGLAEEVGQVVITCTGGVATPGGIQVPTINVQVFLSTNLTSRLLSSAGYSEALLLIDEPAPAIQTLCPAGNPVACYRTGGTGYGGGGLTSSNVFQAVRASDVSVAWLGVPFDPPGTVVPTRVLRITNVRANASTVPFSDLVPTAVTMTISITGTGSLSLSNPVQTVGFVQRGLRSTVDSIDIKQCEDPDDDFIVEIREGFANAFRPRPFIIGTEPALQNQPGAIYNTESMFTPGNPTTTSILPGAGVATQATRVMVAFRNIPIGVGLTVPNSVTSSGGDTYCLVPDTNSSGAGGTADCTGSEEILEEDESTRNAFAVYELQGNAAAVSVIEDLDIPVSVTVRENPLPELGSGSISVSFAPLSTVGTMSTTAPVPRFVDRGDQLTALTVSACRTNLLWPYVTSAAGFDTGLAISNTSLDPFGTATQTGVCRVSYYGPTPSGLPNRVSIGEIKPGEYKAWLLSTGGLGDLVGVPGFTGYVIAQCDFQMAHGYGFITNPGETRWAQGYLALVMDASMWDTSEGLTRTEDRSETLKH